MAGIDHSIYFQQQAPDFLGNIQKGLSMREMLDQRDLRQKQIAEDDALKQSYKAGVVQNADGTTSFDGPKTYSEIMKFNPQKAIEFQSHYQQQDAAALKAKMEKARYEIDLGAQLLGGAEDQDAWTQGLAAAQKAGLDVSKMPTLYDKKFKENLLGRAYLAKDKMDHFFKQEDLKVRRSGQDIEREKLRVEREKINADQDKKKASGDNLPIDQKKLVETLATKNANKIAIKNQIDAVMSEWDNLSPDQQVAAGRQLLKTLNSTEGADAIGAEEAKRLGSKLEFATGNLFNSNPVQFGRDLGGFKEQAKNTSSSIGKAVESNQGQINRLMGRPTDIISNSSIGKAVESNKSQAPIFKTSDIEW